MPLFQFHGRAPISSTDVFSYDVNEDGKRFLVNRYVKPERHHAPDYLGFMPPENSAAREDCEPPSNA